MLVPHSANSQTSSTCHTDTTHGVEYGVSHPLTPSSPGTVLYCTVLYSTVLYCIILYCTAVLYLGGQRAPKSPPDKLEVGGHRPLYHLVI